ncbi:unnamed protein product [Rotaria magnacalcarata]|uniref:Uncharacterized protein n=1 Tax=Rotaria magnacalcarata TaxID=392030 RepID=A0A816NRG1_9BILA|nr:unnamed protein product [Rotaria magnacalcarata]CAF2119796.1 unnamed protein product [Rotaria magnacalcarata]CAF4088687.1 unnamed protein product [Rotaria magnacalcarata]CAF4185442.1 unnamed protein product [Rotaria magnacalcarata]
MAYVQRNRIGFRDTSVPANVPNNDVARLMYYLNCVCTVIEYNDNNIRRYCNCQNWSSLSSEEVRVLLVLCLTLSPDVFNNKVFFQSDELCGNSANKFFEISQVRDQLLVVESIAVADQTRHVNQIMTYKMSWMRQNYFDPVQRLSRPVNPRNQRPTPAIQPSRTSTCVIL